MANATILSIGGVTVSTTGGLTGDLLQTVINTFAGGTNTTTVMGGTDSPSIPGAPTQHALPNVLVIPSDDTGTISIPAGYDYVIYSGTGSLTGGDANTIIVGSGINYTGTAGTVLGTGGTESVTDSTAGANFSFFTGSYSLNASGSGDTLNIDSGASGNVTITGDNITLNLGTPSTAGGGASAAGALAAAAGAATVPLPNIITITGTNEVTNVTGSDNLLFVTGTDMINASGGATTVVTGQGGTVTLNATGGTQVVFDNLQDISGQIINGGMATEFVGAPGAATSTFTSSAGGADTVFAVTSINYQGSAAASTFFLGGDGAATVFAGTTATLFGGLGQSIYHEGTGGAFFWGADHAAATITGSDTVIGGATGAVTMFGNNSENTTISQGGTGSGNIYVAWGQADTINAANAHGGGAFIVVDQSIAGVGNFSGDTTLVGSNAGLDTFAIFAETATTAHTITIENWQATDGLFLGGFNAADSAMASAALAAGAGHGASFTLSDNTTVTFLGTSPTSHA